jgi:hypothetical protein
MIARIMVYKRNSNGPEIVSMAITLTIFFNNTDCIFLNVANKIKPTINKVTAVIISGPATSQI